MLKSRINKKYHVANLIFINQSANYFAGLIQVNNWKPLAFDCITDNLDEPIANLLKDISPNLTLKILTKK